MHFNSEKNLFGQLQLAVLANKSQKVWLLPARFDFWLEKCHEKAIQFYSIQNYPITLIIEI